MAIEVRRNGVWVDNTGEKKRVNGAWVNNSPYKVMKPYISGVPPFTFKSDGENLRDWSITGQTVQASAPTPSSPVTAEGVGVRTGNLFNVSDYSVGGTSFITKRITLEPNTAYTMSSNCPLYNVGALIAIGNVGESFTTAKNGVYPNHPITRTTDENGELMIGLRTNGSDYEPADYETMLNTGSTAQPFEPYGVKIPITCGGTTTNIYLGSASTTRKIKKRVFDGTEGWFITTETGTGKKRAGLAMADCMPSSIAYCTHYPYVSGQAYPNVDYMSINSTSYLLIGVNTSVPDANYYKTYLQQQYANGTPVTIWYVLATPEVAAVNEPLMKIGTYADELTKTGAGVNIPTTNGSNTLSVGTTVQPSEMSIESISQWV